MGTVHLQQLLLLLCHILQRGVKSFTLEVMSLPQPVWEVLMQECLHSGSKVRPFIPINPDQVEFLISAAT